MQESLGGQDMDEPGTSENGPRQPLHPLPTRASLADRLPPRPSELLKVYCWLMRSSCNSAALLLASYSQDQQSQRSGSGMQTSSDFLVARHEGSVGSMITDLNAVWPACLTIMRGGHGQFCAMH